jgi:hypothetical protein
MGPAYPWAPWSRWWTAGVRWARSPRTSTAGLASFRPMDDCATMETAGVGGPNAHANRNGHVR